MSSAAQHAVTTRQVAEFMVKRVERETGSRMVGYERVAEKIGTSAVWLRKFVKGYEVKEPGWTVAWNIMDRFRSGYGSLCEKMTELNDGERRQLEALKEKTDAIAAAFDGMGLASVSQMASEENVEELDQSEWP